MGHIGQLRGGTGRRAGQFAHDRELVATHYKYVPFGIKLPP